jgi:hypothetical protein
MSEDATGLYVCITRTCKRRNTEVEHPWNADWTLAKRQKKCTTCKKRMLFFRVKRVMTEAAKAKLAALTESRRLAREKALED